MFNHLDFGLGRWHSTYTRNYILQHFCLIIRLWTATPHLLPCLTTPRPWPVALDQWIFASNQQCSRRRGFERDPSLKPLPSFVHGKSVTPVIQTEAIFLRRFWKSSEVVQRTKTFAILKLLVSRSPNEEHLNYQNLFKMILITPLSIYFQLCFSWLWIHPYFSTVFNQKFDEGSEQLLCAHVFVVADIFFSQTKKQGFKKKRKWKFFIIWIKAIWKWKFS